MGSVAAPVALQRDIVASLGCKYLLDAGRPHTKSLGRYCEGVLMQDSVWRGCSFEQIRNGCNMLAEY